MNKIWGLCFGFSGWHGCGLSVRFQPNETSNQHDDHRRRRGGVKRYHGGKACAKEKYRIGS